MNSISSCDLFVTFFYAQLFEICGVKRRKYREMVAKCGVSLGTVNKIIALKILKAKLRKKCRVHRLSEAQILK